jgi:hypothetical protein
MKLFVDRVKVVAAEITPASCERVVLPFIQDYLSDSWVSVYVDDMVRTRLSSLAKNIANTLSLVSIEARNIVRHLGVF